MVNTFLYSVYGQGGGNRHEDDEAIAAYRNAWLDALLVGTGVTAVVSLGQLADTAYQAWATTQPAAAARLHHAPLRHPTYPESASRAGNKTLAETTAILLADWNEHLPALRDHVMPDGMSQDTLYGTGWQDGDLVRIPHGGPAAGVAGLVVRPGRLGVPDRSRRADQARDDQRRRAEKGPAVAGPARHPPLPSPEG